MSGKEQSAACAIGQVVDWYAREQRVGVVLFVLCCVDLYRQGPEKYTYEGILALAREMDVDVTSFSPTVGV